MKILNRADFLKQPPGIFYIKAMEPWAWEDICVKGETLPSNDWRYFDFHWTEANDSGELFERWQEMLDKGTSYPLADIGARDGCFQEKAVFMVFDLADLLLVRERLEIAMNIAKSDAYREAKAHITAVAKAVGCGPGEFSVTLPNGEVVCG